MKQLPELSVEELTTGTGLEITKLDSLFLKDENQRMYTAYRI